MRRAGRFALSPSFSGEGWKGADGQSQTTKQRMCHSLRSPEAGSRPLLSLRVRTIVESWSEVVRNTVKIRLRRKAGF